MPQQLSSSHLSNVQIFIPLNVLRRQNEKDLITLFFSVLCEDVDYGDESREHIKMVLYELMMKLSSHREQCKWARSLSRTRESAALLV